MRQVQLFVRGRWVDGDTTFDLFDKYSGETIAAVHEAGPADVESALTGLAEAQQKKVLSPYERFDVLSRAAAIIKRRSEQLRDEVIRDTGFTRDDAQREIDRAIQTLVLSGEEAKRIHGEVIPWGAASGASAERYAFTVRRPLGVVCAITPFNSPLNTLVHKVAPAIAAGNAVAIKPSTYTPLSAQALVEALCEAGLPPEHVALLHGGGSTVGTQLLESPIPAFYAFTGSTAVGEHIRATVGLRRTQLELGGLSSTIVCPDADLSRAAAACANAAFRKAGQVCTSVQRLYVSEQVVEEFTAELGGRLATMPAGDPWHADTKVGPVISKTAADRITAWIENAVAAGASVLTGGDRDRQVIEPTVMKDVRAGMELFSQEVFGPVVSIRPYRMLGEAIDEINDTPYGLSAGIFTNDIGRALSAVRDLRMGSVHVNETSSNRVDHMPYGGVKASGLGLEGPKYAVEEMSEVRLISLAP